MFKRVISFVVALAMLVALFLVPTAAGAANLSDADLIFNVDFNNQDVVDLANKYVFTAEVLTEEDLVFEYDATIGKNVLVLAGDGGLVFRTIDGSSIAGMNLNEKGITMETYVYMDTDPATFQVNMLIMEANSACLHLQEYNDGTEISSGFRAGDRAKSNPGAYSPANAYVESVFPRMKWTHIVGTSDGSTNKLYIDGVLSAVTERTQYLLTNQHDQADDGLYIGESCLGSLWGSTAFYGKIAYAKMYANSATDADVAALYKATTGNDPVIPTPTEAPVVEPTVAPSDAPSNLYFGVDFNSETPVVDKSGNHTFTGEILMEEDLTFVYDEELGRNVLLLEGDGALVWRHNEGLSLNGTDMATNGITLEALVYFSTDPATFLQNMLIVEANDSGLHLQEYNDGETLAGFRAGDNNKLGGWDMANAYIEATFPHMEWTYIVGTSDGYTNKTYIDGELVATYERTYTQLKSQFNQGDDGIYVGESMLGSMWGSTAFYGKMAFVNIYKEAVCEEQLVAMAAESGYELVMPGDEPTLEPINPDWKIKEKTTLNSFVETEIPEGYTVTVTKKGNPIAGTAFLGTGYEMTITVTATGEVAYTEVIVVKGDVSGDGQVKAADYMQTKKLIGTPGNYTDAQKAAADVSGDGQVKAADYMRIKRYINGSLDIYK
ncbi:MAG: hypothetical protein E7388_05355 [Ruminococcaceae bacterium]|nr:hypothetical protein [Oscillospiraceae bacterium]